MSEIILSILTPAVPSRFSWIDEDIPGRNMRRRRGDIFKLQEKLEAQIGNLLVEHLIFCDNKRRTVGEKRDALLRIARGKYVAFVDDDDDISNDYVVEIMKAAEQGPDVITFEQEATVNGDTGIVEFALGNPNQVFVGTPNGNPHSSRTKRNAWHVCAWRRELAILSHFPASNYGEDIVYSSKLWSLKDLKEVHIPKVLHYYRHSTEKTEAPAPSYV